MKGTIIRGPRQSGRGLQLILPRGVNPLVKDCPRCGGRGSQDGERPCDVCNGAGRVETRELERRVVSRCTIPTGPPESGRVCGFPFYEGESQGAIEAHAVKCAGEHHDFIVAHREKRHPEIMKPWDPEYAAWMKRHRDGIMRGHVRV